VTLRVPEVSHDHALALASARWRGGGVDDVETLEGLVAVGTTTGQTPGSEVGSARSGVTLGCAGGCGVMKCVAEDIMWDGFAEAIVQVELASGLAVLAPTTPVELECFRLASRCTF
jgi:hypothetical protein